MKPKILIINSRWNSASSGVDGGSMTAMNIIDALKGKAHIDILTSVDCVASIPPKCYEHIHTYCLSNRDSYKDKFCLRKAISCSVARKIKNLIAQYDKVIIIHVFHAVFLHGHLSSAEYEKIVLFPMFLTPSYEMSNEEIPMWYKEQERVVLSEISHIITPSRFEKKQLVDCFHVNENFITVVPRMVSHNFTRTTHTSVHSDGIVLSCISSFRRQKRVALSIDLIKRLRLQGVDVQMFLVGSIQDKNEYRKFLDELNGLELLNYIHHTECMSQTELNKLFSNVDFNVSFSLCETFGRAIVESLYTGLPNIILDESGNMSELIGRDHGAMFCSSVQDMADTILMLSNNAKCYSDLGKQAFDFGTFFYGSKCKTILTEVILK